MATLPIFYTSQTLMQSTTVTVEEETARHIVQVLRMKTGEVICLTDGKGTRAEAIIESVSKKSCTVLIKQASYQPPASPQLILGVAFTKNAGRNEWLLEKATELGAHSIIPITAERSERVFAKEERWKNILVSAMLQSQQYHLPHLSSPLSVVAVLEQYDSCSQKLIAHCETSLPRLSLYKAMQPAQDTLILIGPEGDFTEDEIKAATDASCTAIDLGKNRLRTETAAMSVCAYFSILNSSTNL